MTGKINIAIIGCGALGSLLYKHFSKLKFAAEIYLFDHDIVEGHNLGYTLYEKEHVGLSKVKVLKERYEKKAPTRIFFERYDNQKLPENSIVIAAVHSMTSRGDIWFQAGYKQREKIKFFFDGRVGMRTFRVYSINPQNQEERKFYEDSLYSDKEAMVEPCSQRNKIAFEKCAHKIMKNFKFFMKKGKSPDREFIFDVDFNEVMIREVNENGRDSAS